jgi:hypothetical protein
MKHSPGPWAFGRVLVKDDSRVHYGVTSSPFSVVALTGIELSGDDELSIANAKLIAATPDLLDALKQMVEIAELTMG